MELTSAERQLQSQVSVRYYLVVVKALTVNHYVVLMKPNPTSQQILQLLIMANGERNFQARWYGAFSWITLCTNNNKAFCFYCRLALNAEASFHSTKRKSQPSQQGGLTTGGRHWRSFDTMMLPMPMLRLS